MVTRRSAIPQLLIETVRRGHPVGPGLGGGDDARVEPPPGLDPLSNDALPSKSEARIAVRSSLSPPSANVGGRALASSQVRPAATRIGPYQLVCELANGGMASVNLTLHRSVKGFQMLCAVKRIHPHLARNRAFAEMFIDEAQIAASVNHPCVCNVFSFGRSKDSYFIAMEFLQGEPLSSLFHRVARSPQLGDEPRFPLIIARLIANLAEGLHAAHTLRDDQGAPMDVVHRDVTPQNLFALYDGSVRVTDFGIARARQRLHHSQGAELKGKLAYIAPELLNHAQPNAQVDIWGLGVVLWELLAGRRLFLGSSEGETLLSVMSHAVPPPSEFRANVAAALDRIVLRALDRDQQRRYQTARDLSRDLEDFLKASGDPVPAMDIAEWMARVFPEGHERIQGLRELAAHVYAATADEQFGPASSSPPTTTDQGKPCSASKLPIAAPRFGSPSIETMQELRNTSHQAWRKQRRTVPPAPARRRPWLVMLLFTSAFALGSSVPQLQRFELPPSATQDSQPKPSARRLAVGSEGSLLPVKVGDPAHPVGFDTLTTSTALVSPPNGAPSAPTPRTTLPLETNPFAPSAPTTTSAKPGIPTGEIYVTTPDGVAEVWAGGRNLGHTPGRFKFSAGRHKLQLRGSNGVQRTFIVAVTVGSSTSVSVRLAH